MTSHLPARRLHWAALILIILIAGFLRIYGQDWDQGTYLHPDERFIAQVSDDRIHLPSSDDFASLLNPDDSPINPRRDDANGNPQSFAYGTLPVYVQGVASWSLSLVSETEWGSYDNLYLVGRTLTAVIDLATLLMVYLIARRLFGLTAGLVSAATYGLLVLPIQLSHFFTVDPWLAFLVTLTLYLLIRLIEDPGSWRTLAVGAAIGCAFATKASVPSLLIPVIGAYIYLLLTQTDRMRVVMLAALGAVASLLVFTIFEPYALVNRSAFIEDIRLQSRIVRGEMDIPYTRQFVGLVPGAYELRNMFLSTTGPAFVIASAAGVVWSARRMLQLRDPRIAILLIWIASYVPVLLYTEARFLRYTLPLLPVLAVLAAGLLASLLTSYRLRALGYFATAAVLITGAVWSFGFVSIYSEENTRISASEWIYDNIEPGATLSAESWDDALPLRLDGENAGKYNVEWMDIYGDLPPEEKVNQLYDSLEDVDYVVVSSDRVRQSVDNMPWRYAVQNEYYRRLFDGQLGFQLVFEESREPGLFGASLDDTSADESFTVYDHPPVRIFERSEDLTRTEFRERFTYSRHQPWEPQREPAEKWLQLNEPVSQIQTTDDAGYNSLVRGSSVGSTFAWLLVVEIIGLTVLPIAARMFHFLPDRGALTTKILGLLVLGWLVWIGASLNLWGATTLPIFVIMSSLALASWFFWYRSRRDEFPLPGIKAYSISAGFFLGIFGFFLLLRSIYPDFWQTYLGGEKPFELAYLRAVAASTEYPPYDPWYSGGIINYYSYGWHLVATVAKLAGVGVSHAFQLAVPTFAAMFASVIGAIALALRGRIGSSVSRRFFIPVIALIMVVFAGNLDAVRQVIRLKGDLTERFDFWGSTRVIDYTINEFPYFSFLWADLHPHVMNLPVLAFLILLLITPILTTRPGGVNGPWGMLNSALFAIAVTITLGTSLVTNAWDMPASIALTIVAFGYAGLLQSVRWAVALTAAAVGIVGIAYAAFLPFHSRFYSVVEGVAIAEEGSNLSQFLIFWGIPFGLLAASLVGIFLTQLRRSITLDDLWLGALAVAPASLVGLLVLGPIWGDFSFTASAIAFVIIAAVIVLASGVARISELQTRLIVPIAALATSSGVLIAIRPAAGLSLGIATAALMIAFRYWRMPTIATPWGMIAIACAIICGVEILYIVDDLQGGDWQRMNTVFKFYLQAWLLLGMGVAAVTGRVLIGTGDGISDARQDTDQSETPTKSPFSTFSETRWIQIGLATIVTGLLVLGLLYPVIATPFRLQQDMPSSPDSLTLDGYAWMEGGSIVNGTGDTIDFTGDLEAIEWLNDEVDGTPVILEAAIGPYRGNGSRISSATGLPTPIGWDRHQHQQRYSDGITQRMSDVQHIYNTENLEEKIELLRRYDVKYIVVGDVERYWNTPEQPEYYASPDGLAAFNEMVGSELDVVFDQNDVKIYEVRDFPSLPPRAEAGVR